MSLIPEWGLMCVVLYTAYFKHSDGGYSPIPEDSTKIEIRMRGIRAYFFKVERGLSEEKWFGSLNGKIFFSPLDKIRDYICDKEMNTFEYEYTERSIYIKGFKD